MILASQSPRRKELLALITKNFIVIPTDTDETFADGTNPSNVVAELSARKSEVVSKQYPKELVIGADTIVVLENKILGKPTDKTEAFQMLKALSGCTHQVLTGVTLMQDGFKSTFVESSLVHFYKLSDKEIHDYIQTGEPMDKAGAYGIQGKGGLFVKEIQGDYFNIVGLPIASVYRKIIEQGMTY